MPRLIPKNAPVGCELLVICERRWEVSGAAKVEELEARPLALIDAAVSRLEVLCALKGAHAAIGATATRPTQLIVAKFTR